MAEVMDGAIMADAGITMAGVVATTMVGDIITITGELTTGSLVRADGHMSVVALLWAPQPEKSRAKFESRFKVIWPVLSLAERYLLLFFGKNDLI